MSNEVEPHDWAQEILDGLFGKSRARIRKTLQMSTMVRRHEVTVGIGGRCDLLTSETGEYWIARPGEDQPANDRVKGRLEDFAGMSEAEPESPRPIV